MVSTKIKNNIHKNFKNYKHKFRNQNEKWHILNYNIEHGYKLTCKKYKVPKSNIYRWKKIGILNKKFGRKIKDLYMENKLKEFLKKKNF